MLGLVADNDVAVYHPVNSSGVNQAGSLTDPTIDAAILALDHSFFVQNWTKGAAARQPHRQRRDHAGVPRRGRHVLGHAAGHPDRVQQELHVRHAAEIPEPAVLPQPDAVGVAADLVRGDQPDRDAVIGARDSAAARNDRRIARGAAR